MSSSKYDSSGAPSSPRRWWDRGTTFFWVAIATILVWIYADMEFTETGEVTLTIRLSAERSKDLVLLSKPAADPDTKVVREIKAKVVFELRGNRRDLDVFVGRHSNTVIQYDVSGALGPGDNQQIPAIKVVSKDFHDDIERYGLSLRSASTIERIHIDQRKPHKVPVQFDFAGAVLRKMPERDVTVWVTDNEWGKVQEKLRERKAKPVLRTVRMALENKEKDKPVEVTVELTANIEGIPVQLEEKDAKLTVTIEILGFTETKTIKVAVRFVIPYTWVEDATWDRYKLTRETERTTWVPEIKVTGAREDLPRLKPEDVDAYVVLTDDDRQEVESWLTRPVKFRFPPDLKVQLTGKPPEVKFKLEPRKAGTTPPGGP